MAERITGYQPSLFPTPEKQPAPPVQADDYEQASFGLETEPPQPVTFYNCVVKGTPSLKTRKHEVEWRCSIYGQPDLWQQERDDIIEARTSTQALMAHKKRLQPGDVVTLTGYITQQDMIETGTRTQHITFVNVAALDVVSRAPRK